MRFLGESPADFHDELAFVYELRFAEPLSDDQCAALARIWSAQGKASAALRAGAARFSGAFVYLTAIPPRAQKGQRALFADVASFVRRVDVDVAPLLEVVMLQAAEDFPDLAPGPAHPGSQRPVDADLPAPAPRESYEAVIRGIERAARADRFAAWTAPPAPGTLGLRIVDRPDGPAAPDVSAALRALYLPDGEGRPPTRWSGATSRPTRRPVGDAVETRTIELVIGGTPRAIELPGGAVTRNTSSPSPDGARVAVGAKEGRSAAVVMVDGATGEARTVWRGEPASGQSGAGVAWLGDDTLLVATYEKAHVIQVSSAGEASVLQSRPGLVGATACLGGRLVFVSSVGFLSWNGKKLAPASKWKVDKLTFHAELGARIVLRAGAPLAEGPDDTYFEVTNVESALAAKPTAKKKAAKPAP